VIRRTAPDTYLNGTAMSMYLNYMLCMKVKNVIHNMHAQDYLEEESEYRIRKSEVTIQNLHLHARSTGKNEITISRYRKRGSSFLPETIFLTQKHSDW
jgi:hypothetical protein